MKAVGIQSALNVPNEGGRMKRILSIFVLTLSSLITLNGAKAQQPLGCPDDSFLYSTGVSFQQIARAQAAGASNYNLSKLLNFKKHPADVNGNPVTNLVLVGAHRGYWEYCPENSTEAFQAALDLGSEEVEMDIRPSAPGQDSAGVAWPAGKMILVHDYDLRGEAPSVWGSTTDNRVFSLQPYQVSSRPKVDRTGNISLNSAGVAREQESLQDLLSSFLNRVDLIANSQTTVKSVLPCISGNITALTRGALLVLDIKGDDSVTGNGYAKFPELYYPGPASQYQTLLDAVKELYNFECKYRVDLSLAIAFKLQLSRMEPLAQFDADLDGIPFPALVFIVYANDVDISETNPRISPSTVQSNLALLESYQGQEPYVFTDWQLQWKGSSLVPLIQTDLSANRGVGGFLPANSGPEGYRNSDGQCNNYRRNVAYPSLCNSFPVNSSQNSSIEFTVPYGGPQQTFATYVLSDYFLNVVNYLQVIGKRTTSWIK